ncbi:MAG: MdtA/MuxA family multidrug efflux RND transporter periplasmic adaptor subunit, partial [Thermoanaerobaculia bacterium]
MLAYLVFRKSGKTESAAGKSSAGSPARAIPVAASPARSGDLGVYLTGLGTVTALNTVTVRSRVDGQLIDVAFREGQLVRRGDRLAQIDPRPFQVQLTQAEGQKAKDVAALENARVDLRRYEVLAGQDAIPRQQLDTQIATVHQDEATVQSDQGPVDSAKLNLTYSDITAPISGRVGLRLVDPGNIVHASDSGGLLVITQLQPIAVIFTIPADQLPVVVARMRGGRRLETDAYDRDMKNRLAVGDLVALDNQIDTSTGTVRLKAEFPNADNALFSNQFVNARLLVNTLKKTVLIPVAAIQRSPQSTFVWIVKPDSTVQMRPVEVLWTEGDQASISKGVAAGERVVVEGVDKLQPGAKVAVAQSGAKENAEAGAPSPAASRHPLPSGEGTAPSRDTQPGTRNSADK